MSHNLNTRLTFEQLFTEGNEKVRFDNGGGVDDESLAWFKKEGYIEDPNIKSKEQLLVAISKNIQRAFTEFTKKKKIPDMLVEIEEHQGRYSISAQSDQIKGRDLGIFANPFEYAVFNLFSGRSIEFSERGDRFFFKPYIWSDIHVSWKHKEGGFNGAKYFVDKYDGRPESGIAYSIPDEKVYTWIEYLKKLGKIK